MLKISRVKVYGLEESVIASGYPKDEIIDSIKENANEFDFRRMQALGQANSGSGHDCALKGIIVQFDVTYPMYWSMQFQRYHFADIVSSQSKMHKITQMNIENCCNKYVDKDIIERIEQYKFQYNIATIQEDKYAWFMKIVSNLPMGFELTMRVTTNYLQLKTIWKQRHTHKLKEDWGAFCDWILTLPKFCELTGIKNA